MDVKLKWHVITVKVKKKMFPSHEFWNICTCISTKEKDCLKL